ncbi:MAG: hypothetical protein E7183_02505 [Erysipelotrichaceae bacterium]|nr:hypothetical protein [Erysipelotrichaceae bacterium]
MINNSPENIILKEIEELKKENSKLKIELEAFKLTQGSTLTIEQFFVKKYLEEYTEILNKRVRQIDNDIDALKVEYDNLALEVEQVQDIATMNAQYQEELNKLELIKRANDTKLNELKAKYTAIKSQYLSKQDVLKNATIGYYKTILRSLENTEDLSLVMTNVEFVMQQLSDQLYLLILECRALSFQCSNMEKVLYETEEAIIKENTLIEENTKVILSKIENRTNEEIGFMQENILNEIKQRETLRNELIETFEIIKERDIKYILDTVNYHRLKEVSSAEISNVVEKIVNERTTNLKSQDTLRNLRTIKQMELNSLLKEKEQLLKYKKRYDFLKEKENNYYNTYVEASKYYDELVEFLDSATLAITENAYFTIANKQYDALKSSEKEIEAQYKIVSEKLTNTQKLHDEKLLAGIHGVEISELSQSISELNALKNELSTKLREVKDAIRDFEKDHRNIKLVTVLREKEFVEARLSTLYNNLRDLKVKINRVKEELKSLEIELEKYNSICERISVLENELQN